MHIPLAVTGGVSVGRPKAQITLAVFDDGSFEGSREEFDGLVKQRKYLDAIERALRARLAAPDAAVR